MPNFSKNSKRELATCHPDLQRLFNRVIQHYDCTIVNGARGELEQNQAFANGASKLQWPDSKHNVVPPAIFSMAVDAAPYEMTAIDWSPDQCLHFGGYVLGAAAVLGISIRWGGDWDRDNDVQDQTFNDLVHFELIK
jgi:peptidoglycan L-alanyl-D-glutamate endopeptidase CwlK